MILNRKQRTVWTILVAIASLALIATSILPYIIR